MTIICKLTKNLVSREAMQLNWELKNIKSSIKIIKERMIDAHSLVGILSGNFKSGEEIKILFDNPEEKEQIKQIFNQFGILIKEG